MARGNYNVMTLQPKTNPIMALVPESELKNYLVPADQAKIKLDLNDIRQLAKNNPELDAGDFQSFIKKAMLTGADPRLDQIHLVTHRTKVRSWNEQNNCWVEEWINKATAIHSYHFFIMKAQSTGELTDGPHVVHGIAPYFNPATGQYFDKTLYATATVARNGKKTSFTAWFQEFAKSKDSDDGGAPVYLKNWRTMPYVMLGKCAIANAMRIAFNEVLNGMYISEEMTGEPSKEPRDVTVGTTEEFKPTPVEVKFGPNPGDIKVTPVTEKSPEVPDHPYESDGSENFGDAEPIEVVEVAPEPVAPVAPTAPQPEKAATKAKKTKSMNTAQKRELFQLVVDAIRKGARLDMTAVGNKISNAVITEEEGETIRKQIENGDYTFFQG